MRDCAFRQTPHHKRRQTVKTFFIHTLGCKINQYESQALREAWESQGYAETDDASAADIMLVNTCAVTERAVSDVRRSVRRMHRENPDGRIVITGCAAQVMAEELAGLPGVNAVVPQSEKAALMLGPMPSDTLSAEALQDEETVLSGCAESGDREPVAFLPDSSGTESDTSEAPSAPASHESGQNRDQQTPDRWDMRISRFARARAVVKFQDGCSHRCTYCIVPDTRGPAVSREPGEVVDEIGRLLESGVREVMLSGVNLRLFGRDLPDSTDFWSLLARIDRELSPQWAGRARLRISSLEPGQLADRGLEALSGCRMLCPHLHVSLQSGTHSVLRRMGRGHYRPEQLSRFLEELRRAWPVFGLGADLIAGFPGETDSEAAETLEFVKGLPLTYAHVFPYSKRPGTPAATMSGQIPKDVKKTRAAALREVAEAKKIAFIQSLSQSDFVTVAVHDAGDEGHGARGVCEYYVDCRFTGRLSADSHRELIRAVPQRGESGYLTVMAEYSR